MTPVWHVLWHGQKLTAKLPTGIGLLFAAIPILFAGLATSSPLRNITIAVPEGTSDHGNPRLLCTPSKWTDVATFVLANFVAHAATVKSRPGEPLTSVFSTLVCTLFFPGFGTARGLDAILRHAVTGSSALQKAKKAGALCQVVRTSDWKPQSEDIVRDVSVIKNMSLREWRIHGVGKSSGLELDDIDLELDDVSGARSQVSDHTESRIKKTANGVPNTVGTDNSITLEPFLPPPRASSRVHSSRVPSHVLHIDGLLNDQMFEPSIHTFAVEGRKVHGICRLPHGFALAPVEILPL